MNRTIYPSTLAGNIYAPASKSSMQRACAAALLSTKKAIITNPGHSNDDKAAQGIIKALGAVITLVNDETIEINSSFLDDPGNIRSKENSVNCGESGLSIRMFTPVVALCNNEVTINGEGSLVTRPMDFFDQVLPQLGVTISSNSGKLPLKVNGPLQPKDITIDGSLSSQFLTGLLMAFSVAPIDHPVTIQVKDLKSKPYIDLTLDVMQQFGMNVPENKNYEAFIFKPASHPDSHQNSDLKSQVSNLKSQISYTVEGDWSGGAFLLVAGAIAGDIRVSGLQQSSTQADKKILEALMAANAGIAMEAKGIKLHAAPLTAFEFDATDCPDLFPPLVALAANCKGVTTIKGVSRLAHKESDRGLTLQQEFGKMGIQVELDGDWMHVHGGPVKGALVHSRHDHRIAMACATAALKANGPTTIEEAQAVNKSYPDFYEHLKQLGAKVTGDLEYGAALKEIYSDKENK
ncbi:3-phosphoshikimate 1-carboxyvinyltransferase [Niabella ginsenosidivorans]|uniref:3-phosphoshikimate 1-carboxyvinyltransferase n=1 Tax=Niabella ginsenosidivorans TaxID=1176587 RepID=A0A1A9HZF6_9BACT|nr:3-phosphoshikimate 1-carboxyvinyltransferase [Niabella ginsenosidivorans]ANH80653.1 3-phosphoshikimate 1-carboxyvinyltransferase [Niabella ginsenosidivorans]